MAGSVYKRSTGNDGHSGTTTRFMPKVHVRPDPQYFNPDQMELF